jgi:uncharacterized membrane protein (DUF485 family)
MTPIGIFLFSLFVAYMLLSAMRRNFMKGRNPSKKQTDVGLLIAVTALVWSLVPGGL